MHEHNEFKTKVTDTLHKTSALFFVFVLRYSIEWDSEDRSFYISQYTEYDVRRYSI